MFGEAMIRILETPIVHAPSAALAAWYPAQPATAAEWRDRAQAVGREDTWLEALRPALGDGAALLERAEANRGVVVTTGQQAGLFGGPLYTWHKALGALEVASAIERTTGVPAVPVFWAATDDADFAEAASTVLAANDGALKLTLTGRPPDGVPASHTPLGDEIGGLLDALRSTTGSLADPRAMRAAESFHAGATLGGAYVNMLRALLEPLGIVVLDAAHPAVANASRAHLARALECAEPIHRALVEQRDTLRGAGEDVRVEAGRELSLVFTWDGEHELPRKRRLAIGEEVSPDARLSPNVLLRPVVERLLLPTVAYLAGPGELAYFSQVGVVARGLGAPEPLAIPRWSGMIVPKEVEDVLERLHLGIEDLRDPHAAESKLARATLPEGVTTSLSALRSLIGEQLNGLSGAIGAPTLDGARTQFEHRIARLERRVIAAAKHRNGDMMRLVAGARAALFPFGKPQERALNAVPFWCKFGDELVTSVREACARHAAALVS